MLVLLMKEKQQTPVIYPKSSMSYLSMYVGRVLSALFRKARNAGLASLH